MRRGAFGGAGLAVCLVASRAAAEPGYDELRKDWALDGSVVALGGAAWLVTEAPLKGYLAGPCRVCGVNGVDDGVRNALVWSNPRTADTVSNAIGFVGIPVVTLGMEGLIAAHDHAKIEDIAADDLVIAEATIVDAIVNQVVKFEARRQRPFVHYDRSEYPGADPNDDNLSFFSAHTSVSMALAVSTGTVASMRGYSWAPLAWAVLPALSLFTGYLRIAADKHYFTDVLTGALVGGGVGFIVPFAFHHPTPSTPTGVVSGPMPAVGVTSGPMATVSWLW